MSGFDTSDPVGYGAQVVDLDDLTQAICDNYCHDERGSLLSSVFRQLRDRTNTRLLDERGIFTVGHQGYLIAGVYNLDILVGNGAIQPDCWYSVTWNNTESMMLNVCSGKIREDISIDFTQLTLNNKNGVVEGFVDRIMAVLPASLPGTVAPAQVIRPANITGQPRTYMVKSIKPMKGFGYYEVATADNLHVRCVVRDEIIASATTGDILVLDGSLGRVIPKQNIN
jgi:hypothetical protein